MFDKEKVVTYIESLTFLLQESAEIGDMDGGIHADVLELMRGLTAILKEEVSVV